MPSLDGFVRRTAPFAPAAAEAMRQPLVRPAPVDLARAFLLGWLAYRQPHDRRKARKRHHRDHEDVLSDICGMDFDALLDDLAGDGLIDDSLRPISRESIPDGPLAVAMDLAEGVRRPEDLVAVGDALCGVSDRLSTHVARDDHGTWVSAIQGGADGFSVVWYHVDAHGVLSTPPLTGREPREPLETTILRFDRGAIRDPLEGPGQYAPGFDATLRDALRPIDPVLWNDEGRRRVLGRWLSGRLSGGNVSSRTIASLLDPRIAAVALDVATYERGYLQGGSIKEEPLDAYAWMATDEPARSRRVAALRHHPWAFLRLARHTARIDAGTSAEDILAAELGRPFHPARMRVLSRRMARIRGCIPRSAFNGGASWYAPRTSGDSERSLEAIATLDVIAGEIGFLNRTRDPGELVRAGWFAARELIGRDREGVLMSGPRLAAALRRRPDDLARVLNEGGGAVATALRGALHDAGRLLQDARLENVSTGHVLEVLLGEGGGLGRLSTAARRWNETSDKVMAANGLMRCFDFELRVPRMATSWIEDGVEIGVMRDYRDLCSIGMSAVEFATGRVPFKRTGFHDPLVIMGLSGEGGTSVAVMPLSRDDTRLFAWSIGSPEVVASHRPILEGLRTDGRLRDSADTPLASVDRSNGWMAGVTADDVLLPYAHLVGRELADAAAWSLRLASVVSGTIRSPLGRAA